MGTPGLVVIKPGALGDTLLLAPALRALRQAYPMLTVSVVGTMPAVGMLRLLGVADAVIDMDRLNIFAPAEAEYALLNGQNVIAFVALEARVIKLLHDAAGAVTVRSHPSRARHSREHMAVYLHRCLRASCPETGNLSKAPFPCPWQKGPDTIAPYAVLAPGAGNAAKRAPMPLFAQAARDLDRRGVAPVFLAGEVEIEQGLVTRFPDPYRRCLNPGLEELAVLLGQARSVWVNDSGPAHLAGLLGAATTVFFGPTDPAVWQPWGARVAVRRFDRRRRA